MAISSHCHASGPLDCSSTALRSARAAVCARSAATWSPSAFSCACSASCCARSTCSCAAAAGSVGVDAPAVVADDVSAGSPVAGPDGAADAIGGSVGTTLRRSVPAAGAGALRALVGASDGRAASTAAVGTGGRARAARAARARAAANATACAFERAPLAAGRRGAGRARRAGTVGWTTLRAVDGLAAMVGAVTGGSRKKTNSRATGAVQPTDTTTPIAGSLTACALLISICACEPLCTTRLRVLKTAGRSSPRPRTCTQPTSSSGCSMTGTEKRSGSPSPESSVAVPSPIAAAFVATNDHPSDQPASQAARAKDRSLPIPWSSGPPSTRCRARHGGRWSVKARTPRDPISAAFDATSISPLPGRPRSLPGLDHGRILPQRPRTAQRSVTRPQRAGTRDAATAG